MKKKLVLLGFVALAFCPAMAQDTIVMRDMRVMENYFVPEWPDTFNLHHYRKEPMGTFLFYGGFDRDQVNQESWRMYTDDTLQVYGIAVSLTSMMRMYPDELEYAIAHGRDTSHANSYEFWRLYEAEPDSLRQISEDLLFHLNSQVSYYVDVDLWKFNGLSKLPIIPIYERYFSTPVPVIDSFYVGRLYGPQPDYFAQVLLTEFSNGIHPFPVINKAYYFNYVDGYDTLHGWYYFEEHSGTNYPYIFPIIAPPDTTTVGVEKPDMVYRYTSVQPNPATERVEVLSSFGVSRVEVFNAAGRKVMDLKAEGLKATLDVSKLPSGAYLLRIHTPQGMTTKKLVVR